MEAYNSGLNNSEGLHAIKKRHSSSIQGDPIGNVELVKAYRDLIEKKILPENRNFLKILRKRGVRSRSGIASITVITKNFPCPGSCIFCPNEPKMPKSYLSNEPAVMRAILNDFSAYNQVLSRIRGLQKTGHITDKADVIVSGGTFSFYPQRYKSDFIRNIFNALNYPIGKARSLRKAQDLNETAANRCIGLSVETRPDHVDEKELLRLREFGVTKMEIGIQSLNDDVLKLNKRGHTVLQTQKALQLIRDAGFKINCHMMPNLYGSNPENDLRDFKELFENSAYRPDWLKIYPCMVVPWSALERIYRKGEYVPYTDDELVDLIVKIKQTVPEYTRITRLYRDIPADSVIGGSKLSNLRQVVHKKMVEKGITCRCIRCREIRDEKIYSGQTEMKVMEFDASGGREFFISFEDIKKDKICALLRLRFTSYSLNGQKHFIKELNGAALIREVHTYGEQVKIDSKGKGESQHIGLGKRMILEAERISRENGFKKIAVISGIGVREYYRKLGYSREGTYMVKKL